MDSPEHANPRLSTLSRMSWSELSDWWLDELAGDPAYEGVVTPLLLEVFDPVAGRTYVDLGGGEGRVARTLRERGCEVIVVDVNHQLAFDSQVSSVVALLPELPLATDSFDGAFCVLALEHIEDHEKFFTESARVVRHLGVLALVINHPVWTAPGSTPVTDDDGEVLWRSGAYFSQGSSEVTAGEETISFHHRTMGELLSAAARSGWVLEKMVERPHHEFEDQGGIPRLLACRWRLS